MPRKDKVIHISNLPSTFRGNVTRNGRFIQNGIPPLGGAYDKVAKSTGLIRLGNEFLYNGVNNLVSKDNREKLMNNTAGRLINYVKDFNKESFPSDDELGPTFPFNIIQTSRSNRKKLPQKQYAVGGKIPNVVAGGIAQPLGNNFFYMNGRKHSQGGIDIGPSDKTGIEVEGGEVVETNGNELKVYSAQPILNGASPAQLVMGGANPNKVFKAQEDFKDRNRINDDGSKYQNGGIKKNNYNKNDNITVPKGKTITTSSGKKISLHKAGGNSHGGKAFSAGKVWDGTSSSGNKSKEIIIGVPGENAEWMVGHHGSYKGPYKFNDIEQGSGLFVPFDENNIANISTNGLRAYKPSIFNNRYIPIELDKKRMGGLSRDKDYGSKKKPYPSFKNLTIADWIGLSSNVAGSLASYFVSERAINKMKGPGQPTLISANKLKTKYNINPQLDRIRENKFEAYRDIDSNTASSRVSLARKQRVRNTAGQAANELYGNKENIETNLINQDRRNQQSVRQFNAQQYNQYIDRKTAFDNGIREAKVTNINNLFSGINAGIQNMISRYENRKALNNTIGAMRASAPNVDDRIMRDAGVGYNKFIIRKRRKLGEKQSCR